MMSLPEEARPTQFGPGQQARALSLIERMAWGDLGYYLADLETMIRRALEATRDDAVRWSWELRPMFEDDDGFYEPEFSLPVDVIEAMSPEEKLAYVSGVLRELALWYGFSECGSEGSPHTSPAGLLRGLNDILWMP